MKPGDLVKIVGDRAMAWSPAAVREWTFPSSETAGEGGAEWTRESGRRFGGSGGISAISSSSRTSLISWRIRSSVSLMVV